MTDRLQAICFYALWFLWALLAASWLSGCDDESSLPPGQRRLLVASHVDWFHDDVHHVSCWLYLGLGISCLRDEPDGGAK